MTHKKLSIVILYVLAHVSCVVSMHSQWTVQRNGLEVNLRDVYALDTNTAWAVGTYGSILHTSDAGSSWTSQNSGGFEHFFSVRFANKEVGWEVGTEGIVLKTTDHGLNWTKQQSNTLGMFRKVEVVDSMTAWIGGEEIMRTVDGGESWINVTFPALPKMTGGVPFFIDRENGWILGEYVVKTTDAGATWAELPGLPDVISGKQSLHFVDSAHGWAVGDRAGIIKWGWIKGTRNVPGKLGWSNQGASAGGNNGFDVSMTFNDVFFSDTLTGWVVGGYPVCRVYSTTDGGESWILAFEGSESINPSFLSGISLSSRWAGWAVGNGLILRYSKDATTAALNDETPDEMVTSDYFDLQGRRVIPTYGHVHIRVTKGNPKATLEMWLSP